MNRAGTDPHPPKKVTYSSIWRPWGRQLELRTTSPLLLKKATCPKWVMNRVKLEAEEEEEAVRRNKKKNTRIINIGQIAKLSSPILGTPKFYEELRFFFPKPLFSLATPKIQN